jgi:hypothetical protein
MGELSGVCSALLLAANAFALVPGDRVDNFRLLDHQGNSHELYYHADAAAIVLMVQGNGCPIVRSTMPEFRAIRDVYAAKNIRFILINSNPQDNRATIAREAAEFGYDLPILVDNTQLIGESLGLVRTAEVLVIDPTDWTLRYRGALNDRLVYERGKAKASKHYVPDVLDSMLDGNAVALEKTQSIGCLINFGNRETRAQISYGESIAPILVDKCVPCHRPGGIAPWAMTSFEMVRGFSPMMREVIRTQRMPPWHADPEVGHFANNRSLSEEETKNLVHWIEAGSPRGTGPDPLRSLVQQAPQWSLGEPDLVIEIPGYEVPAMGVVDYQYLNVENPLGHDVWVRAAELLPGDRQALHHVVTRFSAPSDSGVDAFGRGARSARGGFGGYVPGSVAEEMPERTGVKLPGGAVFSFQMHYTPYGKPTTDQSRLGIYFHEEPPVHRLDGTVMINFRFRIPPEAREHSDEASYTFERDALLYSLFPHAHYRGKAARFRAFYPDGSEEDLLWVPNYDFNWQTSYRLAEPKRMPSGTRITFTMTWDNSAQNPANPDPGKEVGWGQQSWNEMLFGTLSFRYLREDESLTDVVAEAR